MSGGPCQRSDGDAVDGDGVQRRAGGDRLEGRAVGAADIEQRAGVARAAAVEQGVVELVVVGAQLGVGQRVAAGR